MNFVDKIKWRIKEVEKTFSSKDSFYSSKRIERSIIFINAIVIFDLMVIDLYRHDKIDYLSAIAIFGTQLAYAGFQTKQIFKDKPAQNENPV
jgi:hypothetical protein